MATLVSTVIPEIWSTKILSLLDKNLVGMGIVNRDYDGEVSRAGDTVYINSPDNISVGNYTRNTDITFEVPTATQQTLLIDQEKYGAVNIDDVTQAQSNVRLLNQYAQRVAYGIADTGDQFIFGLYTGASASNVLTKATYSKTTIWAALSTAMKNLEVANATKNGVQPYVVVDPHHHMLLRNSTEFQRASDLGDETVLNGMVGRASGFNVFVSNNLTSTTDGTGDLVHMIYGTSEAITFANQISKVEVVSREKQFGQGLKALHVYGGKVVQAGALGEIPAYVS